MDNDSFLVKISVGKLSFSIRNPNERITDIRDLKNCKNRVFL